MIVFKIVFASVLIALLLPLVVFWIAVDAITRSDSFVEFLDRIVS